MADGSADGDGEVRVLVSLSVAAIQCQRDVRTVQRWVAAGRLTAYPDGRGVRMVCLQEVLRVEADIRMRMANRQRQRLAELLGSVSD